MRVTLNEFPRLIEERPELLRGCIVDTNAVFAASMPLDRLNTWAEEVFLRFRDYKVPVYSNLNIRSEFIDLHRRVLIPEGLVSLFDATDGDVSLSLELRTQLKLLKSAKKKATEAKKLFKFNDQQLKKFRRLMSVPRLDPSKPIVWESFCKDYFHSYLSRAWDSTLETYGIQFLGTREIESGEHFTKRPSWKDMTDIVGRYGIGSTDAMIVNFFLCSKFSMLVTGDEDVAYVIERLAPDSRYVLVCEDGEDTA
ncbi:hypothetical protein WDW37_13770 [Bdellovibrionota bacterium FG-1]